MYTIQCTKTTCKFNQTVHVFFSLFSKADVLVGTASEDLQLHKNPCARALSEAAGHTLQQQCSKVGPVAVGDIAVLNQTGNLNCQTVIFAACSSWNNGRGKQVLQVQIYKYKPTETY